MHNEDYINICLEYNKQIEINDNKHMHDALLKTTPFLINHLLTARQKSVVYLIIVKQKTQKEAAEVLGITQSTVCRSYQSALKNLKQGASIAINAIEQYINVKEG